MGSKADQSSEQGPKLLQANLVTRDEAGKVALLGSVCLACGEASFPALDYCPKCDGEVELRAFGGAGRIYAQTVVRIKPPYGLPRPYRAAYIDLDEIELRVFALLDPEEPGDFSIGDAVFAEVGPLGQDAQGAPASRLFFRKSRN